MADMPRSSPPYQWPLACLALGLWVCLWGPRAAGLSCNRCVNADIKADCHLNQEECEAEYVCFVENSITKYTNTYGHSVTRKIYRMGCHHYSMCRDHTSFGAGPYGYATIHVACCCTDRCEKPDGVGKKQYDRCPLVWDNYTMPSAAATRHHTAARAQGLVTSLLGLLVAAFLDQ